MLLFGLIILSLLVSSYLISLLWSASLNDLVHRVLGLLLLNIRKCIFVFGGRFCDTVNYSASNLTPISSR